MIVAPSLPRAKRDISRRCSLQTHSLTYAPARPSPVPSSFCWVMYWSQAQGGGEAAGKASMPRGCVVTVSCQRGQLTPRAAAIRSSRAVRRLEGWTHQPHTVSSRSGGGGVTGSTFFSAEGHKPRNPGQITKLMRPSAPRQPAVMGHSGAARKWAYPRSQAGHVQPSPVGGGEGGSAPWEVVGLAGKMQLPPAPA